VKFPGTKNLSELSEVRFWQTKFCSKNGKIMKKSVANIN